MKKDLLEHYIIENREAFNLSVPDPSVWERIDNDLKKKKTVFFSKSILWKIAAAVVIFASAFLIQEFRYNSENVLSENSKKGFDENQIPELMEAKVYYSGMFNVKMNEIKTLSDGSPEIIEDLNYDISELDNVYKELKEDLKDNISNQEVIEAMISNYRLKLRILEEFVKQLKKKDEIDKPRNERDNAYVKI